MADEPIYQSVRSPEDVQKAIYNIMFAGIGDLRSLLNEIKSSGLHLAAFNINRMAEALSEIEAHTRKIKNNTTKKAKKKPIKKKAKRK